MDPLSDILSLLKPRSYSCAGFDIGDDLCIHVPEHKGIFCYAMLSGEIWFSVEGEPDAMHLKTGDCVVLPSGRPFNAGTDLSLPAIEPEIVMLQSKSIGGVTCYQGGGRYFLIACHFVIDGNYAEILLNLLSPVVHIKSDEDRAALRWALDRMRLELHDPQPGGFLILEHLAHLMLVHALRHHVVEGGVGWLFALGNKEMSAAITAMHKDPAYRWTVDSLAEKVGMSRTNFAVRFKKTVGTSPFDYLRRWRMLLAGRRLMTTREPVSAIALSLGYDSESAFSTAFKTVMGVSPRRYGRREALAGSRPAKGDFRR